MPCKYPSLQRADIGDQRGQVQHGEYLPRLFLQCGLPGQQLLIRSRDFTGIAQIDHGYRLPLITRQGY